MLDFLEQVDETFFLFNPFTNETHILDATTVETLKNLEQQASNLSELLERLSINTSQEKEDYRVLFHKLDKLGLIRIQMVPIANSL
ncbi:MAG: hypothetical protein HQL94_03255 [Magnetococcales bacterium]|nr:hypothetical protein [Magnetococcales bacterium]MBF0438091.1 hypothetical protein [Magnetococcales bacterium]